MAPREGLALAIIAAAALFVGGWMTIPEHGIFRQPITGTKIAAVVAVVFTALAAPLAIGEATADRRFRRAHKRLAAERAWERIEPHEGADGYGLVFIAHDRRVLLLHAPGGVGAPRVVEDAAAVAPIEPGDGVDAAPAQA